MAVCRALAAALLAMSYLALAPRPAAATPPDLLGFGARTSALANTGAAYADGYEATWANPAGIARSERPTLHLGLVLSAFDLSLDGASFYLQPATGVLIGLALPLPFGGPLEDMFSLAAGFYTPTTGTLQTDIPFTDEPQFPVLSRGQSVAIQAGLGVNLGRWVPGLRFGIGAMGLARLVGRLQVSITEANEFSSQTETQVLASFAPIVGASYDFRAFRFGATYRAQQEAQIGLDLTVDGLPVAVPAIYINGLAQYQPHTLVLEATTTFDFGLMLVANLTYRRWSAWPGTVSATTSSSWSPPDPDFHDTLSPRVAGEWTRTKRRTDLHLRVGYAYEPTPAPKADLRQARTSAGAPVTDAMGNPVLVPLCTLDSDRHLMSGGLGLAWRTPRGPVVLLDVYAQAQRVTRRTHAIPQQGHAENMVSEGWVSSFGWTGGFGW